ncbi:asparagine synthase-related protein [Clostridium sp.]|uniref:asparagine synthase-related protein n=1 Tax=Clostridium sp. TaxID=1506 RepID=UPI00290A787C|nr:asparagine synthase-related protein [Clostridium sp.]MDU5107125.1 asparagine synthase-related protein [Clostridium sp.]
MRGTTFIITSYNYSNINLKESKVIENDKFITYSNFNNKFSRDKVFSEDDDILIVLDGVILNNKDLNKKYSTDNNFDLIKKMYNQHGVNFVDMLRGNYYGIIYDYSNNKVHVFTNHLGNKPVYKYFDKKSKTLIVSSDFYDMLKVLKDLEINYSLDELGAYYLLTFGYMIMDTTLISEIKKINPGTVISYDHNDLIEKQYYFIDNENYLKDSESTIIDNMYELFRNSVYQSFSKDEEYGYKHFCYLSGGLDSRMIPVAAKKLGYENITTLTFSENNSRDEKIARTLAADMNFENIFKSLNNGNFLKNLPDVVDANYGQIVYSGASHLFDATNSLNLDSYGFIYNGNLADAMHGDYIEDKKHTTPSLENWAYSSRLLNKIAFIEKEIKDKYGNEEKFAIYNRGINAIYNGSIIMLDKSETCEAYTHNDIIRYCSRMEPKYKYKESAFLKMIQKYYPEATKYKWQKWNLKPTELNTKFMSTFVGKVFRVIDGQVQLHFSQSNNMNPFNKWYKDNAQLREFINNYLKDNIDILSPYSELKKDCEEICINGNITEKTQVMTLIQFMKRISKI